MKLVRVVCFVLIYLPVFGQEFECSKLSIRVSQLQTYEDAQRLYSEIRSNPVFGSCNQIDTVLIEIAKTMRSNAKYITVQESQVWRHLREYKPNSPIALNALSELYLIDNDTSEAIELLQAAVRISDVDSIWIKLGRLYYLVNEFENLKQILPQIEKAVGDDPTLIDGYILLGDFYLIQKKFVLAQQYFLSVLMVDPTNKYAKTKLNFVSRNTKAQKLAEYAKAAYASGDCEAVLNHLDSLKFYRSTYDDTLISIQKTCKDRLYERTIRLLPILFRNKEFSKAEASLISAKDRFATSANRRAYADSILGALITDRRIYGEARNREVEARIDLRNQDFEKANKNLIVSSELEPSIKDRTGESFKEAFAGLSLKQAREAMEENNLVAAITYAGQAMEHDKFKNAASELQTEAQNKLRFQNEIRIIEQQLPLMRSKNEWDVFLRNLDMLLKMPEDVLNLGIYSIDTLKFWQKDALKKREANRSRGRGKTVAGALLLLAALIILIMAIVPKKLRVYYDLKTTFVEFYQGRNGRDVMNRRSSRLLSGRINGRFVHFKHIRRIKLEVVSVKLQDDTVVDEDRINIYPTKGRDEFEAIISTIPDDNYLIENIEASECNIHISCDNEDIIITIFPQKGDDKAVFYLPRNLKIRLQNADITSDQGATLHKSSSSAFFDITAELSQEQRIEIHGSKRSPIMAIIERDTEERSPIRFRPLNAELKKVHTDPRHYHGKPNQVKGGEITIGDSLDGKTVKLNESTKFHSSFGVANKLSAIVDNGLIQLKHVTRQRKLELIEGNHRRNIVPSMLQYYSKKPFIIVVATIYSIIVFYLEFIGLQLP